MPTPFLLSFSTFHFFNEPPATNPHPSFTHYPSALPNSFPNLNLTTNFSTSPIRIFISAKSAINITPSLLHKKSASKFSFLVSNLKFLISNLLIRQNPADLWLSFPRCHIHKIKLNCPSIFRLCQFIFSQNSCF